MLTVTGQKNAYFKAMNALTKRDELELEKNQTQIMCIDCNTMHTVPSWSVYGFSAIRCDNCRKGGK